MTPPCANWSVWVGPETEGHASLSEMTLFIRRLPKNLTLEKLLKHPKLEGLAIARVWFCREFTDWAVVSQATTLFKTVCLEVDLLAERKPPATILTKVVVYWKVENPFFKDGDHVCARLGDFVEESVRIGFSRRTDPSDYLQDLKVC